MLALLLRGVRSLVALGAHPDDVEIGAGGLLLTLAEASPGLQVHFVLLTGDNRRHGEARDAATQFLPGARLTFDLYDFADGRLPQRWGESKDALHGAYRRLVPDLVLCPVRDDAHQDHRLLAELTPTVFRDQLTLHYEIPKWDGDLGRRSVYLPLSDEVARRKAELLAQCFPSQHDHHWWDPDVFLGLARLRGVECRSRYAEAFDCAKLSLRLA